MGNGTCQVDGKPGCAGQRGRPLCDLGEKEWAWLNLVKAAAPGTSREELGKAMRAFVMLAGPSMRPMADPRRDKLYLDWFIGVFGLDPHLASDAYYDHDTAAHDSGPHDRMDLLAQAREAGPAR